MAAASSGGGGSGLLPETTSVASSSSSRRIGGGGGATRTVLGVLLVGAAVALAVVFGGGHYRQAGGVAGGAPKMDVMAAGGDGSGVSVSPPLAGGGINQVDTPPAVTAALENQDKQAAAAAAAAAAAPEAAAAGAGGVAGAVAQINAPPLPALDAASDAASGVLKTIVQPQLTGPVVTAVAGAANAAMDPIYQTAAAASYLAGIVLDPRVGGLIDGCTPANGTQLRFLVENTTCPVITLLPGGNYTLREYIMVKPGRRVSIIGRPLNMPTIDAHRAYRSFTVEPGGFLDLRWCRLYRGKPIRIIRRYYYEIRGGGVYIRAGGTAVITGCLFTVNPILITEFLLTTAPETTVRMLGGYLLMEAGTLTVTDCHFYVTRPGVLFREVYTVGGSILILSGNALFTGCTFTSSLLFVNVVGVGDCVAVFAGNAVFTGCAWTFNCALVAGYGVGFMIFVGGGTVIFTGVSGSNNLGANAFFGSGNGIFCGGGIMILTGVSLNTAVALFAGAGVGAVVSLGGGVMVKTGVSQTSWTACQFVAFLGVAVFVGSGTAVESQCHWARVGSQTAFYGGGGSLYLGSGVATVVNCDAFIANIVANVAAGGGHIAIPAGFLTMVNTYFYKFEVITAHYGQGFDVLILAGGAVFANSGYGGRAYALFHGNKNLVNIWVAGKSVVLNQTYHGAYAGGWGQKEVHYFRPHNSQLKMRHVRLDYKYNKTSHRTRALSTAPHHFNGHIITTDLPSNPSDREFEPRHLEAIAASADNIINSFLSADATVGANPVIQELSSAASAQAAADAVVPPVGESAGLGVVRMQKLPWPGMNVEIPAVPDERRTDNVFIAGGLDDCSLCDVTPGATSSNFDGAGFGSCRVADDCETLDKQEQEEAANKQEAGSGGSGAGNTQDNDENVIMWNPPGSFGAANTSVAILTVTAVFTPKDKFSSISGDVIKAAVQSTSEGLGLPQRYLIRAAPELPNPLMFDNDYYAESVMLPENEQGKPLSESLGTLPSHQQAAQQQQQQGGAKRRKAAAYTPSESTAAEARGATPLTEEELNPLEDRPAYEECSRVKEFKIYLVSDWRNVTRENAQKLRSQDATEALTQAVADSSEAQSRVADVCSVGVTRATALFVPAVARKVTFQGADGTTTQLDPTPASGATSLFPTLNDDDEGVSGGVDAMVAAAAELVDAKTGERVLDVRPGETYQLRLQSFKPNKALTVKLVPADAIATTTVGALRTGQNGAQTWEWAVPKTITPGAYYLEVSGPESGKALLSAALADDQRFAFTQAFQALGSFGM